MGIFDKSNYIDNTGVIEQVIQCTAKVILLAKMTELCKVSVVSNHIESEFLTWLE